jgi:hypothetical protein
LVCSERKSTSGWFVLRKNTAGWCLREEKYWWLVSQNNSLFVWLMAGADLF